MMQRKELTFFLIVFSLAVVVTALFWAVLPAEFRENESTDYTIVYEPVARNLLAGRGITGDDGALATRYPPGFSILLAGVFGLAGLVGLPDSLALHAFRFLCAGLSAVFVYALARLIWSRNLALLAAVAWMTYPFGLYLTKQPNSEVPFTPFLLAAVYLLWRALLRAPRTWWLYLAAGALAGVTMLIRPAALGLGVVLALSAFLFLRNQRWGVRLLFPALLLLANLLVVLPWEAAAYASRGEIIPLSSGGTVTIHDGLTFLAVPKDYRVEVPVPADVEALMWRFQEQRPQMESLGQTAAVIGQEAVRDPVAFIKLGLIKVTRSWYGIDSRRFETPTILLQLLYLGAILWGSLYAWRQGGALRRFTLGLWLIVVYFWGMTVTVVPLLRYMLPAMGLLMVLLPGMALSLMPLWGRVGKRLGYGRMLATRPRGAEAATLEGDVP
jgi:4-amino-4-deoxy-L-arabinose transferase-like glycosyltransferase